MDNRDFENAIKPNWKPKFMSEFSMGDRDFDRYHQTLITIDYWSSIVNSEELPSLAMVQQFLAHLINLWDNFRPLVAYAPVAEEIDKLEKEAIRRKRVWEKSNKVNVNIGPKYILDLVDILRNYKRYLYEMKQFIGLGIVVKKNLTMKQRIKRGVHGDTSLDNLPEA